MGKLIGDNGEQDKTNHIIAAKKLQHFGSYNASENKYQLALTVARYYKK